MLTLEKQTSFNWITQILAEIYQLAEKVHIALDTIELIDLVQSIGQ